MQVVSIGGVKVDSSESQPVSVPARAKAIGSLSHLDETWEYQYKANETGPAVREEPATLWIKLKKLWALFFSPRRTRRF